MRPKLVLWLSIMALAGSFTATAQDKELTLADCIKLASSVPSSFARSQRDISVAKAGVSVARAGFLPQAQLGSSFIYNSPANAGEVKSVVTPGAGSLERLLITSPTGISMPLSSIAHVEIQQDQTEIMRENLSNLTTVTARLEGRDLGSAMNEIKARLFKEVSLPPGTDIEFGGLYQVQQESFSGLIRVLLASIVLIFIILTFEFRSFSHPASILAATLLCSSGALLALLCTGMTLNITSFMGIIMVIGIVQKNGILLLDSE